MIIYLTSKLRPAQTTLEPHGVISFHKPDAQGGWDEILRRSLHPLNDIITIDDRLNMLRDGGIRTYQEVSAELTFQ